MLAQKKARESGIELFRIITMIIIVAHHYVVNSGLTSLDELWKVSSGKNVFLLLFGWGGKTGINCFVLITGYFMCRSQFTIRKFLKLLLEVEFYRIGIYLIFLTTGYVDFSLKECIRMIIPFLSIGTGFTSAFLVFYLFIPFLNLLIQAMNEKQHLTLIGLGLLIYTILPTFFLADVLYNYVTWFMLLYIIAAYIRVYPKEIWNNRKAWAIVASICLFASWTSVVLCHWIGIRIGRNLVYYFVSDSNKILAVFLAVSAFLFFKNIRIQSKLINTTASACFGVLLIHAHSEAMRNWLWRDMLNNVGVYETNGIYLHAILSVIGIYIVCTLIDLVRIKWIEVPFFRWLDKRKGK